MNSAPSELASLLHRTFGFTAFRANQEEVCAAAVAGRDVLLVMPTGAGKSLCYQLPALARGGTALVISPLIALMDDQAAKLDAIGLRVGRIHSGLDRDTARQVCRDYLDGNLQFLFIAPERLRVPGFAAMLAKRTLSLVVIDEAHCISQWGHDFRPDYRTLGQHLPALRPAPIMALTATATPEVQRDIVTQLNLSNGAQFIHGFRRTNLAVEVVEVSKPERHARVQSLLKAEERRPAIVYAPSRKDAESIATELSSKFPAAAYHAGMDPASRDRVQRNFLSGKLEVVVATVAFGMGIDKADVRTVVHTAAPSSVEGFYQEIGRAGRDGLPSRSVLMYSFLDRKTHEFFLDRDYPPLEELVKIERGLKPGESVHADDLRAKLKLSMDEFAPALDRLAAQGVVTLDYSGQVALAPLPGNWRRVYEQQTNFRRSQIDRMMSLAGANTCRMAALVQHFGDKARDCGICDVCAPQDAISQVFRAASDDEERELGRILRGITDRGMSTRKLQEAVCPRTERGTFESMLDALARAGYITIEEAEFRASDGKDIRYRKAVWTHEGREWEGGELSGILLRGTEDDAPKTRKKSGTKAAKSAPNETPLTSAQQAVADRLKVWRAAEASRLKQPSFLIFSDKVLRELARQMPQSTADLRSIAGLGDAKVSRFGEAICAVLGSKGLAAKSSIPAPVAAPPQSLSAQALERAIRVWRMRQAKDDEVAPFDLLPEETVSRIAAERPQTRDKLAVIAGVTPAFAERHGDALCAVLAGQTA